MKKTVGALEPLGEDLALSFLGFHTSLYFLGKLYWNDQVCYLSDLNNKTSQQPGVLRVMRFHLGC